MRKVFVMLPALFLIASAAPPPGFVPSGTQWFPIARTGYTDPLKLTGTVGAVRMHLLPHGGYFGPFGTIEAGPGGGRLNAGMKLGKHRFIPLWTVSTALSVMRTWGDPLGKVESGMTCLGVNVTGGAAMFHLSGGAYRILEGGSGDGDWLWTAGVSLGI